MNGLTKGIEGLFAKNKVDYVKGWGKLTSANTINVALNQGGDREINAKNIILATGSESAPFPGLEYDEKIILSSTGALSLPQIPKDLIIIGGGVIGLELGSVYKRFGSSVTVIEYFDQICPFLDVDIGKTF